AAPEAEHAASEVPRLDRIAPLVLGQLLVHLAGLPDRDAVAAAAGPVAAHAVRAAVLAGGREKRAPMGDARRRGLGDRAVDGDVVVRGGGPLLDHVDVVLAYVVEVEALARVVEALEQDLRLATNREETHVVDQAVELRVREAPEGRHRGRVDALGKDAEDVLL